MEIAKMRDLTDRPWGVNVAQLFVRDLSIVDFIVDNGVRFVTTSAGDPAVLVPRLKAAGITVFHVVPTLRGALKAVAAGVDGLVVEGIEGGGFKNPDGASSMVLLPLIAARVDVPIVAAGGIADGVSMAAAFALGAEGVQMGTRMLTAAESPVHENWKQAVVAAAETDTVIVNRFAKPAMRTLRTGRSAAAEREQPDGPALSLDGILDLYFGGSMEAAYAMSGQVAGRITEVLPVRQILEETWRDCRARLRELGAWAEG
ncbi:MAG: NAD(P)H-dependent flavin oxidoreductase [Acidimicrobiia bacterium]